MNSKEQLDALPGAIRKVRDGLRRMDLQTWPLGAVPEHSFETRKIQGKTYLLYPIVIAVQMERPGSGILIENPIYDIENPPPEA